jgi:ABC-type Fe3+ transport system permease subunit
MLTKSSGSVISSQIYRKWDGPYYKNGNKVLISILSLSVVVFIVQRQWIIHLNKKKVEKWEQMTPEQQLEYQTDKEQREIDGNKRLDFRFAY